MTFHYITILHHQITILPIKSQFYPIKSPFYPIKSQFYPIKSPFYPIKSQFYPMKAFLLPCFFTGPMDARGFYSASWTPLPPDPIYEDDTTGGRYYRRHGGPRCGNRRRTMSFHTREPYVRWGEL
jgi:hypothetical protein